MSSWNDVDSGERYAATLFGRGSGACSHDRHSVNVLPTKAEPLERIINGVALTPVLGQLRSEAHDATPASPDPRST